MNLKTIFACTQPDYSKYNHAEIFSFFKKNARFFAHFAIYCFKLPTFHNKPASFSTSNHFIPSFGTRFCCPLLSFSSLLAPQCTQSSHSHLLLPLIFVCLCIALSTTCTRTLKTLTFRTQHTHTFGLCLSMALLPLHQSHSFARGSKPILF